jgi:NTE family protein
MPDDASSSSTLVLSPDTIPRPRIGICLSGGGFRATAFGFGVVRYLVEAGLAADIKSISSVSGGSVTAVMLAAAWPKILAASNDPVEALRSNAIDRFESVVGSRNLRNRGLVRFVGRRLTPGGRYGSARGTTMVRNFLDVDRIRDLPVDLQVILTATDLTTGRAFRMSQTFIGSWDHGYVDTPPQLRLATALAASTAVPMLFPPVHLRIRGLGLKTEGELSLMDGGVYDNIGLEWFQGWDRGRPNDARDCDFIIAVDCSGPMQRQDRHFGWRASIRRSQSAQYAQSRMSRIRWFVDQLIQGNINGLHVPIDKDPASYAPPAGTARIPGVADPALPVGFAKPLSLLRTDLDRFSADETRMLGYNGYWATHARMSHIRPDLAVARPQWREFAALDEAEKDRLRAVLTAGTKRRAFR